MATIPRLKQPYLGILTAAICIVASLAICALFDAATFGTWVTLILVAMVPAQIILSLVWENNYPGFVARLAQPVKGVALVICMVVAGMLVTPVALQLVGGGIAPPTPYVLIYIIFSVIITFWLVIPMQCWPMAAISQHPLAIGLGTWVLSYLIAYLFFRLFFNFGFLAGSPVFHPELDPQGLFFAWNALSFALTTLMVMMAFVLLDFWPIANLGSKFEALNKQPVFGLVTTLCVLLIASPIWSYFVLLQKMDPVVYMVKVPVSVIFGEFIVLIMMQTAPVQSLTQPVKGLILTGLAVVLSLLMYAFYGWASSLLVGHLTAGGPEYELDLWLASAMLAVTFPMFVIYGGFLNFWPFAAELLGEDG